MKGLKMAEETFKRRKEIGWEETCEYIGGGEAEGWSKEETYIGGGSGV